MDRPARRAIVKAAQERSASAQAAETARAVEARAFFVAQRQARRTSRRKTEAYALKPSLWRNGGDPIGRVPPELRRFLSTAGPQPAKRKRKTRRRT